MSKNAKTVLVVAVLAVGAYLAYRWYKARQAQTQQGPGGVPQLGSNLNSLAPELIGGSAGPSSGPQLSIPVTITLTDESRSKVPMPQTPMIPQNQATQTPLQQANPPDSSQMDNSALVNDGQGAGNTP